MTKRLVTAMILGVSIVIFGADYAAAQTSVSGTVTSWAAPINSAGPGANVTFGGACGSLFVDGRYFVASREIVALDPATNEVTEWDAGQCIPWSPLQLPPDEMPFSDPDMGFLGLLNTSTNIAQAWDIGDNLYPVVAYGPGGVFAVKASTLFALDTATDEVSEVDLAPLGAGTVAGFQSVVPLTALADGRAAVVLDDGTTLRVAAVDAVTGSTETFDLPFSDYNTTGNLVADASGNVYGAVQLNNPGQSYGTTVGFRLDLSTGDLLTVDAGFWLITSGEVPSVAVQADGSALYVQGGTRCRDSRGARSTLFSLGATGVSSQVFEVCDVNRTNVMGLPAMEAPATFWMSHLGKAVRVEIP